MIPPAVSIRLRDRQKCAYAWMLRARISVDVGSSSDDFCSVAFATDHLFLKHLRSNWSNFFDLLCDRGDDVSCRSWSSNKLVLAREVPT